MKLQKNILYWVNSTLFLKNFAKSSELDFWIEVASFLQLDDLDSYLGGLKKDLPAVKNGIAYKYNNGLTEGNVNKVS